MKVKLKQEGDVLVISMNGYVDLLSTGRLKNGLKAYIKNSKTKNRILFNLDGLNFVGSTGLTELVSIIKDFYDEEDAEVKICCVDESFKKLFKFRSIDDNILDEIFENEKIAVNKFDL